MWPVDVCGVPLTMTVFDHLPNTLLYRLTFLINYITLLLRLTIKISLKTYDSTETLRASTHMHEIRTNVMAYWELLLLLIKTVTAVCILLFRRLMFQERSLASCSLYGRCYQQVCSLVRCSSHVSYSYTLQHAVIFSSVAWKLDETWRQNVLVHLIHAALTCWQSFTNDGYLLAKLYMHLT